MRQPQQITIQESECTIKLTTSEVATMIGMVTDLIDFGYAYSYGQDDPDMAEDLTGLKIIKHKLLRALERD